MYKLLHKLFGWDYLQWYNYTDQGIARIHVTPDGVAYYWRYKHTKVIDLIEYNKKVLFLTCRRDKYIKHIDC